jgi:hypothetical protein
VGLVRAEGTAAGDRSLVRKSESVLTHWAQGWGMGLASPPGQDTPCPDGYSPAKGSTP